MPTEPSSAILTAPAARIKTHALAQIFGGSSASRTSALDRLAMVHIHSLRTISPISMAASTSPPGELSLTDQGLSCLERTTRRSSANFGTSDLKISPSRSISPLALSRMATLAECAELAKLQHSATVVAASKMRIICAPPVPSPDTTSELGHKKAGPGRPFLCRLIFGVSI